MSSAGTKPRIDPVRWQPPPVRPLPDFGPAELTIVPMPGDGPEDIVVDPDGRIQIIEINAGGIGRDASELLRKVKAAQYIASHPGEVCPAKWEEGAKTLTPSLDLVGKI